MECGSFLDLGRGIIVHRPATIKECSLILSMLLFKAQSREVLKSPRVGGTPRLAGLYLKFGATSFPWDGRKLF